MEKLREIYTYKITSQNPEFSGFFDAPIVFRHETVIGM